VALDIPSTMGRPGLKVKAAQFVTIVYWPNTEWSRVRLIVGMEKRAVEVCTGVAVWYHSGLPVVPMRWVLVRDGGKICSSGASTNQSTNHNQIEV